MGTSTVRPDGHRVTDYNPGTIGVVCGATTVERVYRKTQAGPLHKATCNRWHNHDGPHRLTRGRDFARLWEWSDKECEARTFHELHRIERQTSERASRGD
jgi:hypothetical protein